MKVSPPFEIKVALMGYVSVGKTTVLNALLRDKYSEVSMKRTTAGVNYFRIASHKPKSDDGAKAKATGEMWSMVVDEPRAADSTLREITADNAVLRESNKVQEKAFDIELEEGLCDMRNDTKLVVVDIPGINEAGASHKYKDYVADKWHSFDCVIVVMDGRQGVNTEEQVNLLKFVADNCQKTKDVPIIILCNKVDDPDDEEQQVLVVEAQEAVERIFKVNDRTSALDRVLSAPKGGYKSHLRKASFPIFIPVSAIHGFIYRTSSQMSFDQFKKFDKNLIDKLGRDNLGKRWKRLTSDEKLEKAFDVANDPEMCREGLEDSNFDKFLTALSFSVGGEATQLALIETQIDVATKRLSPDVCLADALGGIADRCRALGRPTEHLSNVFWKVLDECERRAFTRFHSSGPSHVFELALPFSQLIKYHSLTKKIGWSEESAIVDRMKRLIRHQLGICFEQKDAWTLEYFHKSMSTHPQGEFSWAQLSPKGWEHIFGSIIMVAHEPICNDHFCREKLLLDTSLRQFSKEAGAVTGVSASGPSCPLCWQTNNSADFCRFCNVYFNIDNNCGYCQYQFGNAEPLKSDACESCENSNTKPFPGDIKECMKIKFENGHLVPLYENAYKRIVGIDIPESGPSDPHHYGHLLWKFCRFMETIEHKQVSNTTTENIFTCCSVV